MDFYFSKSVERKIICKHHKKCKLIKKKKYINIFFRNLMDFSPAFYIYESNLKHFLNPK